MNKDLLTTIFGALTAVVLAVQTYNAPPTTSKLMLVVGYAGVALTALWGYFTNKS